MLVGLGKLTDSGINFEGITIKLTCDIDLGGFDFPCIQNFAGTLDGQGHTISNCVVLRNSSNDMGFFGTVTKPITVKNLTFDNISVLSGENSLGIIIGTNNAGGTIIDNCVVKNCTVSTPDTMGFSNIGSFGVAVSSQNITLSNTSITNCSFLCNGSFRYSFGCVIGSANSGKAATAIINNCSVNDCTFGGAEKDLGQIGILANSINDGYL